jgi:putative peptide zinc metalloprotease protein
LTATSDTSTPTVGPVPDRADGVELLGPIQGSGYKQGAALVRRADGQMVQMGPLMYAALECIDGMRDRDALAEALSDHLGRRFGSEQVDRLVDKLAEQGLLQGSEYLAPPRRNPLLALRWKVLVTGRKSTRRLTAPFTFLFRPWVMWPILLAFVGVLWFVLIHKGVSSATAQAFHSPGWLLLVFALAVLSAGFHEIGHAAACRYGGGEPGGMGAGIYLVWPAFYTDVTDAYRLPRRDRLRVDLAGLYFNAVVAVATMVAWLAWRVDALLLLIALQVLQMVKQLSPVIRADGYHILSDATGIPDLYSHMGPTMRSLLPGRRHEPAALRGWPRVVVTLWVLVVVPVLLSLMLTAMLLLPHLATSAWDSGRVIAGRLPHQVADAQLINLMASLLRLVALVLPVAGSALVAQKVLRSALSRAKGWSDGRPGRRTLVTTIAAVALAGLAWALWPSGQYQPVRAGQGGTIGSMVHLLSAAHSSSGPSAGGLPTGTHLAVVMVPAGGPTTRSPAYLVLPGTGGHPPRMIVDPGTGGSSTFPFALPGPPGPGGTQALAVGSHDGGVTYTVAYALVTVDGGQPVTETNSAFAFANCRGCTTVAVSFQVVLVVGQSNDVAPINAAGALNYQCPACVTTAVADQMVISLNSQPSAQLLAQLEAALQKLNALPELGASGTPAAIESVVSSVQTQIQTALASSGLAAGQATTATTTSGGGAVGTGPDATSPTTVGTGPSTPTTTSTPPSTTTSPTTTQPDPNSSTTTASTSVTTAP